MPGVNKQGEEAVLGRGVTDGSNHGARRPIREQESALIFAILARRKAGQGPKLAD